MSNARGRMLAILAVFVSIGFFAQGQQADNYPDRPIRWIVPAEPGGGFDTTTRQLQPFFERRLGTNFRIENHPGGNNAVGINILVNSPPDGYTMMLIGVPHLHFSFLVQDVSYTYEDLYPLGQVVTEPGVIRVRDDAPWADLAELIEYARTQPPGTLRASVSFLSSSNFLGLKQLEAVTGVEFNIVPFGGGQPARNALLGGQVDLTHAGVFNSLNIEEGSRVIGVQMRSNDWPDLTDNAQTFNEQLGTDMPENSSNYGIFVQRAMVEQYPERHARLVEALEATLDDPEFIQRMADVGEDVKFQYIPAEEYDEINRQLADELLQYRDFWIDE